MRKPLRFGSVVFASLIGTLFASVLILLFGLVLAALMATGSGGSAPVSSNSVLVLDLNGNLPEHVSGDSFIQAFRNESSYGLYDVMRALDRAAEDRRIKALWIKPGNITMSWATLQSLRRSLETFKASGKPVIASSPTFMTSEKAYFLSLVADSIYAEPESMFELNGFSLSIEFYKRLFDRFDVKPQIVRAGTYKSAVEPYLREDLSEPNRSQLQALVDRIDESFMSSVSSRRGLSLSVLAELIDNESILTSRAAKDAHLLDDLLYEDEVRAVIKRNVGVPEEDRLRTTKLQTYVSNLHSDGSTGEIAVVYASGAITGGRSSNTPNPFLGSTTVGSETFVKALRRARDARATKAVVIRIDSPGGFAPAADAMLREIKLTAAHKPVVISMGSLAASGGYWIATGADTIVAESLTITGSIGVFSLFFDVSGLFADHLGITHGTIRSRPQADMLSGLRSYTEIEQRVLQASTDATYRSFLEKVAASRSLSVEAVDRIGQGRIWTGRDALDVGLVDTLGGLDTAIEIAAEMADLNPDDVGIQTWPKARTFFEELNDMMSGGAIWMTSLFRPQTIDANVRETVLDFITQLGGNGSTQALMPVSITVN